MQSLLTITLTATLIWGGGGGGGMDMREGTVKHIKTFQILSSFRNIILSVPTTFVQDRSVLSISFNICQIIIYRITETKASSRLIILHS